MGADLLIAIVIVKTGTNLHESKTKMLNKVENLTHEDIKNAYTTFLDYYGDVDKIDLVSAKELISDTIVDLLSTIDNTHHRELTYIEHKGDTIYITGGMSWGDSPTDLYDIFSRFSSLPPSLLKLGGFK